LPSTSDVAIRARGLGRRFELRDARTRSLKEAIVQRRRPRTRELWALRDVDVEIARGETFGIVGQNGSGKSTLLKLFAGIFPPSEGQLEIDGVVGSLLEVGAGFHPEFSGIENVYLNAAIYGINRDYVEEHLAEIIEFAELEEFASMPVKTYSSGMYTRLGFSVAMHMEPDILLLDEVLAVGDEAFQQKCYGKIWEFKRAGGTMVFVSHDPHAVELLCDRAILLERGRVTAEGSAQDVLVAYHRRLAAHVAAQAPPAPSAATGPCSIVALRARDGAGNLRVRYLEGEPLVLELVLTAPQGLEGARVSIAFRTPDGLVLAGRETGGVDLRAGLQELVRLHLVSLPLREGTVALDVRVTSHDASSVLAEETGVVDLTAFSHEPHALGVVRLDAAWELPAPLPDRVPDPLRPGA
jgi:ABC-type polysaccharide/polyol phosphate transport system ATPase subunit